jgi:hypothetical protein
MAALKVHAASRRDLPAGESALSPPRGSLKDYVIKRARPWGADKPYAAPEMRHQVLSMERR